MLNIVKSIARSGGEALSSKILSQKWVRSADMTFDQQTSDHSEPSACHSERAGRSTLRLQLPQLMRNVGFASETCRGLSKWQETIYKDDPLTHPLPPLY